MPPERVADALRAIDAGFDAARRDLEELVRIPSVSAAPEHRADVHASAEATARQLERAGLERVRLATVDGSHPYVIGEWSHAGPDAPTVLLYAHHDVQPPGVVERWASDPFVPEERGGRLYGRGTADDKAGAVAHACAVGAWLTATGALPCNVRVVVEGEEEIGSPSLHAFLTRHRDELRSDVLVLADAGNWRVGVPGLTYSLRGLVTVDVELRALDGPVHSGMAGGAVPDPMMALARVLASMVDEHGDPAVDGLWDDVAPLSARQREPIAGFDDAPDAYARALGLRPGVRLAGDPGVPVHARLWWRPALTVIGIDAHPITGSSNQILARAAARVSLRLAPGQDPRRVADRVRAHVERRVPFGLELHVRALDGAPAWSCSPEGPAFDAAVAALREGFGAEPVLMGVGGSIPFVGPFADAFGGIPALLLGPSDPHSRIHGEDESLHLGDWRSLMRAEVLLLAGLGARSPDELRAATAGPR
ncbi:MAG: dipeptidase [Acidimicrobiia bacterium]|nr:MAG: dipeptidase [Acidimicrobiia bacterium]